MASTSAGATSRGPLSLVAIAVLGALAACGSSGPACPDVSGTWEGELGFDAVPGLRGAWIAELQVDGAEVIGRMSASYSASAPTAAADEVAGVVDCRDLRLTNHDNANDIGIVASVDGASMTGYWTTGDTRMGGLEGQRASPETR